jgi:aromatic ring-cleaving dioxygenase
MLNTELDLLPKSFPKELRQFDAHIYYDAKKRNEALLLREKASLIFQDRTIFGWTHGRLSNWAPPRPNV